MLHRIPVPLYRLTLATALVAITWLAVMPTVEMPNQSDKLAHILAFLVLTALADLSFPARRRLLAPVLPLLLYGAGLEILQHFQPQRVASIADFLANGIGVAGHFIVRKFYTEKLKAALFRPKIFDDNGLE